MNRRNFLTTAALATLLPIAGSALAASPDRATASERLWDPRPDGATEGEMQGPNGSVYHRIYGKPGRIPVIVVHGGPAAGHAYMRPYAALATDREVVLYDQSGSGLSSRLRDLSAYSVDRYVAELDALRQHMAFEKMCLIGHGWGGMLALAYARDHGDHVASLVLASTAPAMPDLADATNRWIAAMGPEAVATLQQAEASGTIDDPAYERLVERYRKQHVCRLDPWPVWFESEEKKARSNPVRANLRGPDDLQFEGTLKNLDLKPTLAGIRAPTLVTCGEFDSASPWIGEQLAAAIPGGRFVTFPGLSHMTHIESPRRVIGLTAAFLSTQRTS
jgi:proline-specific peptidase